MAQFPVYYNITNVTNGVLRYRALDRDIGREEGWVDLLPQVEKPVSFVLIPSDHDRRNHYDVCVPLGEGHEVVFRIKMLTLAEKAILRGVRAHQPVYSIRIGMFAEPHDEYIINSYGAVELPCGPTLANNRKSFLVRWNCNLNADAEVATVNVTIGNNA